MATKPIAPQQLSPTSAAVKYHSMRVFQQTQVWMGNACCLPPEEWGWQIKENKITHILTDLPPAPQNLLKIRCQCKTGCSSHVCNCRKHGIDCSTECRNCGGNCSNGSYNESYFDEDFWQNVDEE